MPQPQLQRVQINEMVQNVARLLQAQLQSPEHPPVECRVELAEALPPIAADPELLHRAFSNLALNAIDAMPQGANLTFPTPQSPHPAVSELPDTATAHTAAQSNPP